MNIVALFKVLQPGIAYLDIVAYLKVKLSTSNTIVTRISLFFMIFFMNARQKFEDSVILFRIAISYLCQDLTKGDLRRES